MVLRPPRAPSAIDGWSTMVAFQWPTTHPSVGLTYYAGLKPSAPPPRASTLPRNLVAALPTPPTHPHYLGGGGGSGSAAAPLRSNIFRVFGGGLFIRPPPLCLPHSPSVPPATCFHVIPAVQWQGSSILAANLPDMDLLRSSDAPGKEAKSGASLSLGSGDEHGDNLEIKSNGGFGFLDNCEDTSLCAGSLPYLNHGEEMDVDVVGRSDNASECVLGDDVDATEYSSSFGDTFSGSDERLERDSSDAEVDSPFSGHSVALNGAFRVFRKKKLTPHWQKYVRPLRWRCNWLELRMKELHSQALKYERELSACNEEKSTFLDMLSSAKSVTRTVPFACNQGKYAMKRKLRKRIEDRIDVSTYMSCHNVFSYYEKGIEVDDLSVDDGFGDNVVPVDQNAKGHDGLASNHEWPMLDFADSDNSLEHLLLEIETIQSRVVKLRTQLNKTVDRKATGGSALSIVYRDLVSSSGRSPSHSPVRNGDAPPLGTPNTPPTYLSECETEDLVLSESAVSSFGDAAPAPNIIESTVSLLAVDQNHIGDARDDSVDDILISNQAAKEELQNFEKVGRSLEKPEDIKDEEGSTAPRVSGSETGSETERTVSGEPALKRCSETVTYVRRSKRPRMERRLSPSSWHCEKIGKRRYTKSREHS
ncbi:hypothetical protein Taro_004404 [Colocasia esculenta]|uniref:Uncharacterized protein n=1 Tax=Colocasia esculenta TaxID=4460 RepID=A0A843TRJ7_COLES|nr:hypothetical protein [Colocasia esculenta]